MYSIVRKKLSDIDICFALRVTMSEMLTRLPPEVLGMVVEKVGQTVHIMSVQGLNFSLCKLTKTSLKLLSQTSRFLHAAVLRVLWRSVLIRPWTEFDLHLIDAAAAPQTGLQLAKQLNFRSDLKYVTDRRCPHTAVYDYAWDADDEDDIEAEYEDNVDVACPRFDRLAKRAKLLIGRLEENQLQGFRYAMISHTARAATIQTDSIIAGTWGHAYRLRSSGPMAYCR